MKHQTDMRSGHDVPCHTTCEATRRTGINFRNLFHKAMACDIATACIRLKPAHLVAGLHHLDLSTTNGFPILPVVAACRRQNGTVKSRR